MAGGLSPVLAFAAGALTILSPCVLPLVPIVLGSAAQRHRWGPLALATGLVLSFSLSGFLLATVGVAAGFDGEIVRMAAAVMLLAAGLTLLVPVAQRLLTRALAPLADWANRRQQGLERFGLVGQAAIGVLLGLVWTPCVGPTLGAATALAAEGKDLSAVALTMTAFGLGIAATMLALATATQTMLARWRGSLLTGGAKGKIALGGLLSMVALLILTGSDHLIEGYLVQASPDWLLNLTTSI